MTAAVAWAVFATTLIAGSLGFIGGVWFVLSDARDDR